MIIKSTARKQPSFRQLIEYMEKEDGERLLCYNLYGSQQTPTEQLISQFETNAQLLPKRKNGNYLYHEIISFEKVPADIKDQQLKDIFHEVATLYLEERAKHQLAFVEMHKDTDHLHLHFCISANELGEKKRVRLSKAQLLQIQKNLENYVLSNYPELKQSKIYTKEKEPQKLKTTDREQSLKKRTKQASRKEQLKTQLHGIFEQANTQQELIDLLQKNGFSLYTRGKTVGVIKDQKKYRLKTLGLLPHYQATNERLAALETEKEKTQETPKHQEKLQTREEQQPQPETKTTKEDQQTETSQETPEPQKEAEPTPQQQNTTPEPEPQAKPQPAPEKPESEPEAPSNEQPKHRKPRQQRRERPSAPHRQDKAPAPDQTQPQQTAAPEQEQSKPSMAKGAKKLFENVKDSVSSVLDALKPNTEPAPEQNQVQSHAQSKTSSSRTKTRTNQRTNQKKQTESRLDELDQLSQTHAQAQTKQQQAEHQAPEKPQEEKKTNRPQRQRSETNTRQKTPKPNEAKPSQQRPAPPKKEKVKDKKLNDLDRMSRQHQKDRDKER